MFSLETLETLIRAHGLLIMTPLAILEGPVVTVIAGYFVRLGYFSLSAMLTVVMMGKCWGYCLLARALGDQS